MTAGHTEFPASQFAITSVNVPDRLDQREVDDRKLQDEASSLYAAQRSMLSRWARKLAPYLAIAALLFFAAHWFQQERQTLGPARISQQLTSALKIPVQVQDTRFRATPAPAFVLLGVDLGGKVRFDQVALEFKAPDLWQAIVSGHHRWGDVVISPTTLDLDQSRQLLDWLGALNQIIPNTATKVRISELRVRGTALLSDRYEALARREPNGQFSSVTLRRLDEHGSMQLQLTPDPQGGPVAFQCDGADWQPPFVPKAAWTELFATGHIGDDSLDVEKFTLGAAFGAVNGQLGAHRSAGTTPAWVASGRLDTVGIDIATLVQQLANRPTDANGEAAPFTSPMSGTAALQATVSGTGDELDEALGHLVAQGEIKVRNATLNGINLGYAASRPSDASTSSGASTRFTQFDTLFLAGSGAVIFRQIHGLAGAMSTHGELAVASDLGIEGLLHVDLGGSRIQAPLRVPVHGRVVQPRYGR